MRPLVVKGFDDWSDTLTQRKARKDQKEREPVMAKDPITGEEIPDINSSALKSEGDGTPPATGDTGDKFKFADREFGGQNEAEKAYKEMQSRATKSEQELADMRKRVEQAENPLLQKLVEVASAKQEAPGQTEAERKHIRESVLQDLEERGNEAILDLMAGMSNDVESAVDAKYRAEMEKLNAKISELESGFGTFRDTSSEVYKANKDRIEKLQSEGGFSREQALKIVTLEPRTAPAMAAPAGTGGGSSSPGGGGGRGWTEHETQEFKKMYPNATPKEIEDFKKAGRRSA